MIGFVNTFEFEIPEPQGEKKGGGGGGVCSGGSPKQEVVLRLKLGGAHKKM